MAHVSLHKVTFCLLFLTTTFLIANSARILDEVDPQQPQVVGNLPLPGAANPSVGAANPSVTTPSTTLPSSSQTPAPLDTESGDEADNADPPVPETEAQPAVNVIVPPAVSPAIEEEIPVQPPQPVLTNEPTLSFFMHDIIGGSHPSARVVAGIVANTDVTGLPFAQLNNNLFPITGGIPLVNPKLNGIITNNNLPNLVGLGSGQSSVVFQNRGTNNVVNGGGTQPFVSAGNLPAGFTLQKLMFGSITVVDDQLTEGHELDSAVIGRAQGFYIASSLDGSSQIIALTVLLHSEEHHEGVEDSISFFGVHRTASHQSEVAVIGGTGKYENAKGYAALETLLKEDQHTTDGADTILHFNVYLTQ